MSDGFALGAQTALFLDVAQVLSQEYVGELSRWNGSPFQWLIGLAPRRKGAIGEKLVDTWLTRNGFDVKRPKHTGCDRIIEGINFEVKLSTLWGSGIYTFQQLRNQDYAYVFCLGLSPMRYMRGWLLKKSCGPALCLSTAAGSVWIQGGFSSRHYTHLRRFQHMEARWMPHLNSC